MGVVEILDGCFIGVGTVCGCRFTQGSQVNFQSGGAWSPGVAPGEGLGAIAPPSEDETRFLWRFLAFIVP